MTPTVTDRGTVVIAGLAYQITAVELKGGQVVITASRRGAAPEMISEVITIFGQDGQGIAQGGEISIERVGRWGLTEVTVRLRYLEIIS